MEKINFKIDSEDLISKIKDLNFDGTITTIKNNLTIEDLKQTLINELSNSVGHLDNFKAEIELLKIILDYENDKPTNQQNSMYTTGASIQCSNKKD